MSSSPHSPAPTSSVVPPATLPTNAVEVEQEEIPTSKPLIGKNTFVWTLSGLAFTTGLTIALIPALRRNRQRQHLARSQVRTTTTGTGTTMNRHAYQGGLRAGEKREVGSGGAGAGGVLDGLLGPPSTGSISSSSSSSSSSSRIKPGSSPNSSINPKLPRSSASTHRTGSGESLVSPSILSSLPALHTGGSSSGQASDSGSSAGGTDTVGSSSTPTHGIQNPPDQLLQRSSPSSVIPTSPLSHGIGPPSTTDSPSIEHQQEEEQPQIKYFSIHPSDPFSDEEDEFGFPRHDPADLAHHIPGELGEGEQAREGDDGSPFWALKAFSIATGLVVGSAVIGVGLIGWGFGVSNMEEFTAEMRRLTAKKLPSMSENIFKPLPEDDDGDNDGHRSTLSSTRRIGFEPLPAAAVGVARPSPPSPRRRTPEDVEEETIVSGWWKEVVEGAEEERRARVIRSEAVDEGEGNHQV